MNPTPLRGRLLGMIESLRSNAAAIPRGNRQLILAMLPSFTAALSRYSDAQIESALVAIRDALNYVIDGNGSQTGREDAVGGEDGVGKNIRGPAPS